MGGTGHTKSEVPKKADLASLETASVRERNMARDLYVSGRTVHQLSP